VTSDPFADAAEQATHADDLRKVKQAAWNEGYNALAGALNFAGRDVNPGYDCAIVVNPYYRP
jgi:hypothetical protein